MQRIINEIYQHAFAMVEGSKIFVTATMNDDYDLCCDDLLHEIAIGSVEGLLDDGEDEVIESPMTPEGDFTQQQICFGRSIGTFATGHDMGHGTWSNDVYAIPPTVPGRPESLEVTTVMLRNIPNKYTRAGLLVALSDYGFDPASCNNLYLPMDTESGCNLGYAFLNFVSHGHALEFKNRFDGCRLPSSGSRKICSVVWANKQGLFQFANTNSQLHTPPVPPVPVAPISDVFAAPGILGEYLDDSSSLRYHQLPPAMAHMESTKIFIGGLPVSTSDADLFNYFSKFGPIKECNIIINRETGLSRGFGFVNFVYQESVRIVDEDQQRRPHVINCRVVSVRFYGAYTGAAC